MDIITAIAALTALAQEHRLEAFRLLVAKGPDGLPAGDIARHLGIPHNTLSTHIATLERGGLVTSRREGRRIIYRIDFDGTRKLLSFILEDCCRASSALCTPAIESALTGTGCCSSPTPGPTPGP